MCVCVCVITIRVRVCVCVGKPASHLGLCLVYDKGEVGGAGGCIAMPHGGRMDACTIDCIDCVWSKGWERERAVCVCAISVYFMCACVRACAFVWVCAWVFCLCTCCGHNWILWPLIFIAASVSCQFMTQIELCNVPQEEFPVCVCWCGKTRIHTHK